MHHIDTDNTNAVRLKRCFVKNLHEVKIVKINIILDSSTFLKQ